MTFDPTADRLRWAEDRVHALRRLYGDLDGIDLLRAMIQKEYPGRIAVTSSFGAEAAVLLDMVARVDPATPVLVLTWKVVSNLSRIDGLSKHLGLSTRLYRPSDE
jgi:phosphoadenosine phosphosulfate reductase